MLIIEILHMQRQPGIGVPLIFRLKVPIVQQGQNPKHIRYHRRLEWLLENLLYNPHNIAKWEKKFKSGYYYHHQAKFFTSLWQKIFRYRFQDYKFHYVAVSHIDAAWLWPVIDTKIRVVRTFEQGLENCRNFPFMTLSLTSPQYYQWYQDYTRKHPELWAELMERIRSEQIEPTGGMWIEPDLDMPAGESLVRQRLYGMLWYQREFGKMPEIESLLDVFGFPYSLPQILKKSGAKAFWTTKEMWNDQTKWLLENYFWQGVDGTQIFTHQFPFNWAALTDTRRNLKMGRLPYPEKNKTPVSSKMEPTEIESLLGADRIPDIGVFYGWGDGGKGPMCYEVGIVQSLSQLNIGKHTTTHDFFNYMMKKVGDRCLVWDDEMYLEFHRGTKITQNEIKHYNRQAELWANAAETLITGVNALQPGCIPIDKSEMFEMWRLILFNQFHDILPGSSIPDVYEISIQEQKKAIIKAKCLIAHTFSKLGSGSSSELLIYNPFPWARSEYLTIGSDLLYIDQIPPMCVQSINPAKIKVDPTKFFPIVETIHSFILENENITVDIDKQSGGIVSLYYKSLQRDLVDLSLSAKQQGSGIRVYHDFPRMYPPWNIERNYPRRHVAVKICESPHLITLEDKSMQIIVKYQYLHSFAEVRFSLRPKDQILRITITTDNHDPRIIVKYFFPLALQSEIVTSEIPYASIERKRVKRTTFEKAKWEMNMHKWIDISDKDYGVTIINDNRYGFNATQRGVYITLTRTPVYSSTPFHSGHQIIPQNQYPKYHDLKPFTYQLGILPHKNGWQAQKVWQYAANFNLPLITKADLSSDHLQNTQSSHFSSNLCNAISSPWIRIESPQIGLGAFKPTEWQGVDHNQLVQDSKWQWDNQTLILRLIERSGQSCQTNIYFHPNISLLKVEEVDLLERNGCSVPYQTYPIKENCIMVSFTKFEIKTLRLTLKKNEK